MIVEYKVIILKSANSYVQRKLSNIYGGTEMMDNIYEEYGSMKEFEDKMSNEHQPSLGKAVDNSVVFIMDENLKPKKVCLIL